MAYAETNGSGQPTYDYEHYHHSQVGPVTRRKITTTLYHIHTSGEPMIKIRSLGLGHREYITCDCNSHQSRYRRTRSDPDDENDCSCFERGQGDSTRLPRDDVHKAEAKPRRMGPDYKYSDRSGREHPEYFQPEEPTAGYRSGYSGKRTKYDGDTYGRNNKRSQAKPKKSEEKDHNSREPKSGYTSGYSGKPTRYDGDTYGRNNNRSQAKPKKSEAKDHNSSSSNRWDKDPRSKRNDHFHEDDEEKYYQEAPKSSPPKGPRPINTDELNSGSESQCRKDARSKRNDASREDGEKRHQQEAIRPKGKEELPDHYATLSLEHLTSAHEIKLAAKRRRVEVHPDRLKKAGMSESECGEIDAAAAKVGQAAEILLNPEQKEKYDRKWQAAQNGFVHRS